MDAASQPYEQRLLDLSALLFNRRPPPPTTPLIKQIKGACCVQKRRIQRVVWSTASWELFMDLHGRLVGERKGRGREEIYSDQQLQLTLIVEHCFALVAANCLVQVWLEPKERVVVVVRLAVVARRPPNSALELLAGANKAPAGLAQRGIVALERPIPAARAERRRGGRRRRRRKRRRWRQLQLWPSRGERRRTVGPAS